MPAEVGKEYDYCPWILNAEGVSGQYPRHRVRVLGITTDARSHAKQVIVVCAATGEWQTCPPCDFGVVYLEVTEEE